MTAVLTNWGASCFLDVLFGQREPLPTGYWVALCTQAPGAQADGTLLSEPDPNAGYTRSLLNNNMFAWNPADTGLITSNADVVFSLATDNWDTVSHYALCDAQHGGNVYLYASLATTRQVLNGDVATIPAGMLSVTLASLSNALVSTF